MSWLLSGGPACCDMMISCAASTGLSERDERVRVTAAASGERPGQGRGDPGAAPPDHGAGTGSWARPGRGSPWPIGRSWPHCCTGSPGNVLGRLRLLIRPDTVLRWHRDLLARRHAARSRPKSPGRPRTVRSIRQLVLRLAGENPSWATGASTANSSSSGSRSRPPPCGRSCTRPGSTRHPSAPLPPGPASSAPRPGPCSPATSSRPSP